MARYTKLTREAVRALAVGKTIMEHGIEARRMKDGSVRWGIDVVVDGVRVHRQVGRDADGVGRAEAEAYLEQVRTDARHDRLNLPKGRKVALTVAKACEDYLAALETTGGKNLKSKREHINLHIVPALGTISLRKVSDFTLANFRKGLRDKGRSDAFANRVAATWSHMVNWLASAGKVDHMVPKMPQEREDNGRDVVISADEERALLAAADADPCPFIGAFLRIGLGTGLRHREIVRLAVADIDWARGTARVRAKGGRVRSQSMPASLCDWLQAYRASLPDPDGFLFPSERTGTGHTDRMNEAFRRIVKAAGLDPKRITPHTMRHTAVTRFSAAVSGNPKLVQRFSGHRSLQMVMRYTHPSDGQMQAALDRMAAG